MGEQAVQASWSHQVGQVGPAYCPGACGGRGPGTSVTSLGPLSRPFIGVHSWAVGLPKGSHSEAGRGTAGAAPRTKGAPEASACERQGGGHLLHPVSGTKAQLWGPLGPAFLRQRKEPGPALAEQPHKAIATRDSQTRSCCFQMCTQAP